ncbi:hypothetical protein SAMN05216196_1011 [Lutimaribacter pacificus]|uniref:Uncharacterized protein n=1 Tax=Lutimaribacter pacificus TaxID=391948 RepID=A0A1H0A1Z8_9RHOB|nr:hypothetical protein [Lutimaribacter pacificus]SDN27437.1 hypothetical protein SAMN05216196_1011 [Lutimaribacter pacificus]SHJ74213.1 hypothetical protein SAMN05444142_1011216 [Lutimaribacter pacificus]
MNKAISGGFAVLGLMSWYDPGFNGFWLDPSDVSDGDGRIVAAVFLVGAAIVFFQRD